MTIVEFIRYYSVAVLYSRNEQSGLIPRHQIWNYDYFLEKGYEVKEALPEEFSRHSIYISKLFPRSISRQIVAINIANTHRQSVLYAPFMFDAYFIAFLKTIGVCHTPLVAIAQDTWNLGYSSGIFNKLRNRLQRFIVKHGVDKLLFISPAIYQQCKSYFNIQTKHIPMEHWGVDYEFYNNEDIGQEIPISLRDINRPYVFVTGGSNRDFDIMNKLASLSDDNFSVVLQTNHCPEHIVSSKCLIVDRTPQQWSDLLYGYRHAFCVAVPLDKTIGYMSGITVVLEGMACGKPIISTFSPHYPFNIEKEKTGIYVPHGDVKAWYDAVRFLLDNPEEAKEMGERGRFLIKNKHNYKMFCKELEKHVQDCIS